VGFSPESALLGSRDVGDEAVKNYRIMAEADSGLVADAPHHVPKGWLRQMVGLMRAGSLPEMRLAEV
jgi:hypothetical protein